jgi:predicted CoA-substrate-specific enzyme activase
MLLGVDIGSMAISAVRLNKENEITGSFYEVHHGQIGKCLQKMASQLDPGNSLDMALTASTLFISETFELTDIQTALIRASRYAGKGFDFILHVGAEKFYLVKKDPEGRYESSRTNTSCAAGTGSFLDQQVKRLDISSIEEFCRMAEENGDNVPDIASRCSVFAKTDLIHAQQEGHSLGAICDGLCKGLAKNITDTLFHDTALGGKILFTGGVSKNEVVAEYIREMLQSELTVHPYSHLFGALGAGLLVLEGSGNNIGPKTLEDLVNFFSPGTGELKYYYPPLDLSLSQYPDFSKTKRRDFNSNIRGYHKSVEVELFEDPEENTPDGIYIGFDIGSTSTKAIISTSDNLPLIGYYTYTSGKPIEAVFCILEALETLMATHKWSPVVLGVGTTGSGRKLIGKILNADLILDEITAHARAAIHLDPEIDTIIEIGGQDAKFTVLRKGEVVFSQMNAVCAAGTGSFIEEQASKLDVSLEAYAGRVEGKKAPLTSDRCTVFMERDINNFINEGYVVDELLAAVLFSVRDNYLKKVALEGMIGEKVCFQGATARNKALVAAFEQKLGREIFVSRLCHLTGAFGINLVMEEEKIRKSRFRGLSLYQTDIPIRTEICELCSNHCKLTIASIKDEDVAYGFLCGRDYETPKYVAREKAGFRLLTERKKSFDKQTGKPLGSKIKIGIPSALHMFEEIPFWRIFFREIGVDLFTSNTDKTLLKVGKHLAGAEFCAPIESMYGHVKALTEKVDYIFLPVYIETRDRSAARERNYCYYTQFSPSIVSQIGHDEWQDKFIVPEMDFSQTPKKYLTSLYRSLEKVMNGDINIQIIQKAWETASRHAEQLTMDWKENFSREFQPDKGLSVVLLGRPYVILSGELNKSIPEYFSTRGIRCFFQDMLPVDTYKSSFTREILLKVPWHYAANILGAADYIARTPGLYPVLVTAFKCAPDSFIIDYLKKVLEAHSKPYLILQIDEHDSAVGYETRIEAALRSFRNHVSKKPPAELEKIPGIFPRVEQKIGGKTLLLPNWDPYSARLLTAVIRNKGIDARLLEPSDLGIRKSMAHNTGQCIPINIVVQDAINYIQKYSLDPANTLLWMAKSRLTCNFRLYPEYIKTLMDNYGQGMEKVGVYEGIISNLDLSIGTSVQTYFAYMLGGLIRKMGCQARPYEIVPGSTNRAIEDSLLILENAFGGRIDLESGVTEMSRLFNELSLLENGNKPEVAIFGDLFVRDHEVMNQNLIDFIENAGGVVVTTPYHDYVKITASNVRRRMWKKGEYTMAILSKIMLALLDKLDMKYYRQFESIIGIKEKINPQSLEKYLDTFNVKPYHSGESYDNLLKIFHILEYHPDLSLFIQTNPAFCCPALITEAMTGKIKAVSGVPVVTVTYDGTSEGKNDIILPYLVAARERMGV